jgi:hypothetical protein
MFDATSSPDDAPELCSNEDPADDSLTEEAGRFGVSVRSFGKNHFSGGIGICSGAGESINLEPANSED